MAKKTVETPAEENAVAIRTENAVANNTPQHLQQFSGQGRMGFENMRAEDMVMPRVAIAQAMSPQVTKSKPEYIKGLEPGMFFNTLTGDIYGEEIVISPITYFQTRYFFAPRGSAQNILCFTRILDEQGRLIEGPLHPQGCDTCPHSRWLTEPRADGSKKPDCTLFYNYLLAIFHEGNIEPAVLSLKSKNMKPAKKLNSNVLLRRPDLPPLAKKFTLYSVAEETPKGTFYNFNFRDFNLVDDDGISMTHGIYNNFREKPVAVDMRDFDPDDDGGDASFIPDQM
jgi:hypothetical protein